mgnify:CR=1 FL=1
MLFQFLGLNGSDPLERDRAEHIINIHKLCLRKFLRNKPVQIFSIIVQTPECITHGLFTVPAVFDLLPCFLKVQRLVGSALLRFAVSTLNIRQFKKITVFLYGIPDTPKRDFFD